MDFERQQYIPPETTNHSLRKILLVSVLIHALVGWLILSQQRINIPAKVDEPTSAIKAKLVFFPPPKAVEKTIEAESNEHIPELPPEQTEQNQPREQTIEDSVSVEEVIVAEVPVEDVPAENQASLEKAPLEQEVQVNQEPEIVDSVTPQLPLIENDTRREDLPSIDFPDDSESDAPVGTSRNLAQKHLLDHSAQANQRMAEQEAQRYRQQRESPDLNLPKFDPYKTEDEKLIEENRIRVDCSSTVNKTLLTVLRFTTGGTMDCSKPQDFEPFIDKHVKKPTKPKDKR
ncbi:hypothetical protein Q4574_02300 [Aliiglaciecola sp. 3_MG-2023]|uniref:hypothetical protein n=1 Tax=Aliiglaciecola sp. 3_MG-2023 TaxID=3062644 RepID=UPI0026E177DF|nr:hypothetical protein [Aliiglaciecola sp. 3_MG-2023]MDO6692093.1 hypothetical protein [Aliiglaciecola sp. 3_MG-2023]